ncbi:N-acetylmuramoyl-L-alanine amidase [Cyanobium sp. NIES-981]|uniref:N-acetylmuramoyl-L-alanine amidase n=1 Tax=Cyanobium sp. NIES-981 TaxID=1851505 RepID=UPI000B358B2C|nr:N-acetylmuramoyl-L-alanine amidase [Cyanobium sp. NIES-981]
MARCPFAIWKPITGGVGAYLGGPFKIVHHTTEGSTASSAMRAYQSNRSDPHFTVDSTTIYQHIDTGVSARSLFNADGGVQTNRDSAIQIEVVGFAGKPKSKETLNNISKLCRWIEATHGVPKVWPNGFPKTGSTDPGGHNRNATNWDSKGGHYGHSHVPENDHWDPGYTKTEVEIIMGGRLESVGLDEGVALASFMSQEQVDIQANLSLVTHSISLSLDNQGQGVVPLDFAWERVISVIPKATRSDDGKWQSCIVSLAEQEGQTLLVVTGGVFQATVSILVKVFNDTYSVEESVGCP